MTDEKSSWNQVADQLEALALKLKLHYEQSSDGGFTQAMQKLRDGVQGAFEAAGAAVKDEAVRHDVREVGRLVADAVSTSMDKVGDTVRGTVRRKS